MRETAYRRDARCCTPPASGNRFVTASNSAAEASPACRRHQSNRGRMPWDGVSSSRRKAHSATSAYIAVSAATLASSSARRSCTLPHGTLRVWGAPSAGRRGAPAADQGSAATSSAVYKAGASVSRGKVQRPSPAASSGTARRSGSSQGRVRDQRRSSRRFRGSSGCHRAVRHTPPSMASRFRSSASSTGWRVMRATGTSTSRPPVRVRSRHSRVVSSSTASRRVSSAERRSNWRHLCSSELRWAHRPCSRSPSVSRSVSPAGAAPCTPGRSTTRVGLLLCSRASTLTRSGVHAQGETPGRSSRVRYHRTHGTTTGTRTSQPYSGPSLVSRSTRSLTPGGIVRTY